MYKTKTLTLAVVFTSSHLQLPAAQAQHFPNMPEAVANNAVAQVNVGKQEYLLSFNGLATGNSYKQVHNKAFALKVGEKSWQPISPVPIAKPIDSPTGKLIGRLASIAVGIGDNAYVFGGYTVAQDHSEVSVPDVYKYNVVKDKYTQLAPMPVPVDDAVALTYSASNNESQFIYLVSGWHNSGNVNLVQLYNTKTNTWSQATPFPGKPVFGHAGGIVDSTMVICDGVKIEFHFDKRRSYASEPACYKGVINEKNPERIDWRKLKHPTDIARYRMAAKGLENGGNIVFIGGSNNPYNYSGLGYNGQPSEPDAAIWRYNLADDKWHIGQSSTATMDHRGLVEINGQLITLGGMETNQKITNKVVNHSK